MCLVFASGINLCSVINMTFYAAQLMCVAFHSFVVHLNQQIRASPESLILKTNPESVPSCDTCWLKLHKCILYLVFRRSFKQLHFWLVLAIWVQRCHPLQPSEARFSDLYRFPCHRHVLFETRVNYWDSKGAAQINTLLYKLGLSPAGTDLNTHKHGYQG